jgi:hypothetical protein
MPRWQSPKWRSAMMVTEQFETDCDFEVVNMTILPKLKFLALAFAIFSVCANPALACDPSHVTGGWDFCELEGDVAREIRGITWVDCQAICDRDNECQGWNSGTPGMDMRQSSGIEDEVCQLLSSVTGEKHYSDSFHSAFKSATSGSSGDPGYQGEPVGEPPTNVGPDAESYESFSPECPAGGRLEYGICHCENDGMDPGCGCPPGMINGGNGSCYCADPNSSYNKKLNRCF